MSDFDRLDLDVFLSDFATTVTCTTWGTTVDAIFDEEGVEFDDLSGSRPSLLMDTTDVPASADTGDLFTLVVPTTGTETTFKLVDVEQADPGFHRVILALT